MPSNKIDGTLRNKRIHNMRLEDIELETAHRDSSSFDFNSSSNSRLASLLSAEDTSSSNRDVTQLQQIKAQNFKPDSIYRYSEGESFNEWIKEIVKVLRSNSHFMTEKFEVTFDLTQKSPTKRQLQQIVNALSTLPNGPTLNYKVIFSGKENEAVFLNSRLFLLSFDQNKSGDSYIKSKAKEVKTHEFEKANRAAFEPIIPSIERNTVTIVDNSNERGVKRGHSSVSPDSLTSTSSFGRQLSHSLSNPRLFISTMFSGFTNERRKISPEPIEPTGVIEAETTESIEIQDPFENMLFF